MDTARGLSPQLCRGVQLRRCPVARKISTSQTRCSYPNPIRWYGHAAIAELLKQFQALGHMLGATRYFISAGEVALASATWQITGARSGRKAGRRSGNERRPPAPPA